MDEAAPEERTGVRRRLGDLVHAVVNADQDEVRAALERLSSSRSILAPLGWVIGTLLLLFQGLRLILVNWRLTAIELLPAIWIGLTWWELRAHAKGTLPLASAHGWILVPIGVAIALITLACYWCNATFALVLKEAGSAKLRPAFAEARRHARFVNTWGLSVGAASAVASTVLVHRRPLAFTIALGAVAVVMMTSFVSVPAALLGTRSSRSVREKASGAAVGGVISVVAQTPGFLLDRLGLLLFTFKPLRIVGLAIFVVGVALQAAAVSSVRAVKLSSQFVGGDQADEGP
jgi:hypothetical protein